MEDDPLQSSEHRHPGEFRDHGRPGFHRRAVVAGQTFYIFTIENLKQFGALKAIGVTNARITAMILLQNIRVSVFHPSNRGTLKR